MGKTTINLEPFCASPLRAFRLPLKAAQLDLPPNTVPNKRESASPTRNPTQFKGNPRPVPPAVLPTGFRVGSQNMRNRKDPQCPHSHNSDHGRHQERRPVERQSCALFNPVRKRLAPQGHHRPNQAEQGKQKGHGCHPIQNQLQEQQLHGSSRPSPLADCPFNT